MSRRLRLAVGVLAILALSAGCVSPLGGGGPSDEQLREEPTTEYRWNGSADATIDIRQNSYLAVYTVRDRQLPVYGRNAFGMESPIEASALRYRYPNGTVIAPSDAAAFNVTRTRDRLLVNVPQAGGQVGFTAPAKGNTVGFPVYLEAEGEGESAEPPSYEMILPPNTDIAVPLLASVRPGGYSTSRENGRVHIFWAEVNGRGVSVRFYLQRDLFIFGGLVGIGTLVGTAGAAYYLVQIRRLRRRREEVGLDIDVEDDSRDPPPGMG